MRIGIDVRLWNQTGVGRYTRSLVINLAKIDKKNEYVLFCLAEDEKEIGSLVFGSQLTVQATDIRWHSIAEQIKLPSILNPFDLDLMHFPYFSVPVFYRKPFVITVHDLIVNKYSTGRASTLPLPFYVVKRIGYHAVLGSAVKRAKKIIVPSYAVRDDVFKEYPLLGRDKVEVTYEGGFDTDREKLKDKSADISGKYFLRVGNYYPHKNVEGLLEGFRLFLDERKGKSDQPKLVLVGKKDYFYERMEKLAIKFGIGKNVLFLDKIDDQEIVVLYKNAIATVIPSFAEGFSLTAVEAMSSASPVVASGIPVHKEVCGQAAIYFDPNNIQNIAERLEFVLDLTDSSRKQLIDQGKKQSKKFSWEKMAEETLKIYDSAI